MRPYSPSYDGKVNKSNTPVKTHGSFIHSFHTKLVFPQFYRRHSSFMLGLIRYTQSHLELTVCNWKQIEMGRLNWNKNIIPM